MVNSCLVALLLVAPALSGAQTAPATQPAGKMKELAADDGKSAGKMSAAGGGHAIAFDAPGAGFALTGVRVFGSRYGTPDPPAEDFHVFLLDGDGKTLKDFAFPYKTFLRGEPRWVTLKVDPTPLPPGKFFICLGFNPERTKGVYVHYDSSPDGDSRIGLPGSMNDAAKGDWMIRAIIAKDKER
ncbi:MAG: hypothetical protein WBD40_23295 [Tepidisphaeraceae bacterium]